MAVDSPLGVNVSDHADFQFTEKAPTVGVPGLHSVGGTHEPQTITVEQAKLFAAQLGPKAAETLARHGFGPDGQPLAGQHPGHGSNDTLQAVEHLSANWKGDPAALKAELNRLGYQEDTRTDAQRAFDQSYAAGDYGLSPHDLFHGFTDMPVEHRVEVTEAISETMAALGVGRAFGRAVAAGMAKSIAEGNEIAALPLDQQEQALAARDAKTKAVVERVLGKPWDAVMNDLRPIVAAVPAELRDVLARSLESPDVLVWLHRSGSFRASRPAK